MRVSKELGSLGRPIASTISNHNSCLDSYNRSAANPTTEII